MATKQLFTRDSRNGASLMEESIANTSDDKNTSFGSNSRDDDSESIDSPVEPVSGDEIRTTGTHLGRKAKAKVR